MPYILPCIKNSSSIEPRDRIMGTTTDEHIPAMFNSQFIILQYVVKT
jgi:hypothetical protein